ncbi:MAG: hypothetical protein HY435_02225 [Candidatus Liptonbacteria bacterium]|nr:hypothetical protein [Candidatus Liptonbacteria bacterium]
MTSRTPQFDKALDAIFKDLKPHTRACGRCAQDFEILSDDIDFYHKLRVPPPTLCFLCRYERRLGHRQSFKPIFYKKPCSVPGHTEKVITFYPAESTVRVYDDPYYLSDAWDPLTFGQEYDLGQSFFSQWYAFAVTVPHQTLQKDPKSVNSDYVVSGVSSKNCYYVGTPYHSENIYYGRLPVYSKDSIDVEDIDYCEWCYECIRLARCYNCAFCYDSKDCIDSYFLFDCRNCANCFGCVNLMNKSYCFFNEQLTKEEYRKKVEALRLGKRSVLRGYQAKFDEIRKSAIRKHVDNVKVENVVGDELEECRNCFYAFRVFGGSENIRYISNADRIKESMDVFGSTDSSLLYEATGVPHGNDIKFSILTRTGMALEYCIECNDCEYCFGCFGLRNKKYCIFNKRYSESDYWQIVDKIKAKMLADGEYGEFFPLTMSPVPYNNSNASVEFPLEREEVLSRGWYWYDEPESDVDTGSIKKVSAAELPEEIKDVGEEILEKAIICEETGKPFRITKFELDFYRKKNIPLPAVHPLERIKRRLKERKPSRLWQITCSRCGKEILTSYALEKRFTVYCEACYLKEVA